MPPHWFSSVKMENLFYDESKVFFMASMSPLINPDTVTDTSMLQMKDWANNTEAIFTVNTEEDGLDKDHWL